MDTDARNAPGKEPPPASPCTRGDHPASYTQGKTMNAIEKFFREEDGVTALEYGLLAAVVAGALIVVAGPALNKFFGDIFTKISQIATQAFAPPAPSAGS